MVKLGMALSLVFLSLMAMAGGPKATMNVKVVRNWATFSYTIPRNVVQEVGPFKMEVSVNNKTQNMQYDLGLTSSIVVPINGSFSTQLPPGKYNDVFVDLVDQNGKIVYVQDYKIKFKIPAIKPHKKKIIRLGAHS